MRTCCPQPIQRFAAIAVALVGSLAIVFDSSSCSAGGYAGPVEALTIGFPSALALAPIVLVREQQFFAANGLAVTMKEYPEGADALNGLLKGEVDVAGSAEYAIVGSALKRDPVRILANLNKSNVNFLIGRRDRRIAGVADLKGKRVAVTLQTAAEFYLGRFLNLNGIKRTDVTRVDLPMLQMEDALVNGSVDAIVTREPNLTGTRKRLGANGIVWSIQSFQPVNIVISARADWTTQHPELVKRFLNALALAEDGILQHPVEAKAIAQKRFNLTDQTLATLWPAQQFSLSLDESLIAAMQDEARWTIENNLTTEKTIPNFLSYLYIDGLQAVKPESVTIIR